MPKYLYRIDIIGGTMVCPLCGLRSLFYLRGQVRGAAECDHAVIYTERRERIDHPVLLEDARAQRLPPFDQRPDLALERVEGGPRESAPPDHVPLRSSLAVSAPSALLNALEHTSDAIFAVDRDRRIAFVNARAEALLRRERGALLGAPAWRSLPQGLGALFEAHYRHALATDAPVAFEAHVGGGVRYAIQARASREGFVVFTCAVEAGPLLEATIRVQDHLLDRVGVAMIATDPSGTITHWNAFAARLYGWSRDEALGRSIGFLSVRHDSPDALADTQTRLQAGIPWSGAFLARRKDGTIFQAHVADAPIRDANGATIGVAGISRAVEGYGVLGPKRSRR